MNLNPALTSSWIDLAYIYFDQAQEVEAKIKGQNSAARRTAPLTDSRRVEQSGGRAGGSGEAGAGNAENPGRVRLRALEIKPGRGRHHPI